MDLGLSGRVAIVGASANGLGLATARRLAEEGCNVALCDIDEVALERARAEISAASDDITVGAWRVDLMSRQSIDEFTQAVADQLGPVDILVTNAGGPPPGSFDDATDDKWARAFDLTLMSAVRLTRNVLPSMKDRQWGRILNFTSRTLREPIPNLIISNAVRLAVAGMAKTLAGEVAEFGITVNNLGPGPTSTDRATELAQARAAKKGIDLQEELAVSEARIPRGRMARPEELASVAAFLASDLAGHITGQSLIVDGGETRAL